jgi:hypothetical protein
MSTRGRAGSAEGTGCFMSEDGEIGLSRRLSIDICLDGVSLRLISSSVSYLMTDCGSDNCGNVVIGYLSRLQLLRLHGEETTSRLNRTKILRLRSHFAPVVQKYQRHGSPAGIQMVVR